MSANPRPQGNAVVLDRLARLAELARGADREGLHHAYVLAGPEGVGKFAAALWWAASAKCAQGPACPGCPTCRQIAARSHRDVHIVEPDKPGGRIRIEQTRTLVEAMARRPAADGPNVAIVRDADRMTPEAQNSLLKLLEEPPGYAVLILVADNLAALLPTVRSRCQILRFGALDTDDLRRVLLDHGTDAALAARLAAAARGSVGRALALTAESLDALENLLAAVANCGSEEGDIEALLDELIARKADGYALEDLLAWQLAALRARLGVASDATAPAAPGGRTGEERDPAELARLAERILVTASSLERNANAKIAIRDLLLHMRG
jgi:DNA polymerase-3 subunit delta'